MQALAKHRGSNLGNGMTKSSRQSQITNSMRLKPYIEEDNGLGLTINDLATNLTPDRTAKRDVSPKINRKKGNSYQ